MFETANIAVLTLGVSALLTGVIRRRALADGMLDVPNDRSSHSKPTPRGGGLAIVTAASLAIIVMGMLGNVAVRSVLAVVIGGIAVAAIGFIDDRFRVKPATRLLVHLVASTFAVACLGGLPALPWNGHLADLGWAGDVLGVLGIVWAVNLFNFMDGIDGIAASEAVFVCVAGAFLGALYGSAPDVTLMAVIIGSASAGFLVWNWPPARIFMGDVGSGYLGFVIAVLGLAAARDQPVALVVWLILGAVFLVDATVTLIRRVAQHERIYEAHRWHAYQRLARRWGSHLSVTVTVLTIDLAWLLPLAWLAVARREHAVWALTAAALPLAALALVAGAGRSEKPQIK